MVSDIQQSVVLLWCAVCNYLSWSWGCDCIVRKVVLGHASVRTDATLLRLRLKYRLARSRYGQLAGQPYHLVVPEK
jgi:hypothetical protein